MTKPTESSPTDRQPDATGMDHLADHIARRGWAITQLPGRNEDVASLQIAVDQALASLGKPIHHRRQTGALRPSLSHAAHPSSLSAAYGLRSFPLHSDAAHWPTPPRYLALYCRQGGREDTATVLLNILNVTLSREEERLLSRAVFFVRNGRHSFYSPIFTAGRSRVRFDPGCMVPVNADAKASVDLVSA